MSRDNMRRMPRLIWVFAGRTLILLVLSCRGSYSKRAQCIEIGSESEMKPGKNTGRSVTDHSECHRFSILHNHIIRRIWIWPISQITHNMTVTDHRLTWFLHYKLTEMIHSFLFLLICLWTFEQKKKIINIVLMGGGGWGGGKEGGLGAVPPDAKWYAFLTVLPRSLKLRAFSLVPLK